MSSGSVENNKVIIFFYIHHDKNNDIAIGYFLLKHIKHCSNIWQYNSLLIS